MCIYDWAGGKKTTSFVLTLNVIYKHLNVGRKCTKEIFTVFIIIIHEFEWLFLYENSVQEINYSGGRCSLIMTGVLIPNLKINRNSTVQC